MFTWVLFDDFESMLLQKLDKLSFFVYFLPSLSLTFPCIHNEPIIFKMAAMPIPINLSVPFPAMISVPYPYSNAIFRLFTTDKVALNNFVE